MNNSIHSPIVRLQISDGEIEIRELSWPDAIELYGKLREQAEIFIGENGQFVLDPQKLVAAISQNIQLSEWLVKKATGKDENWLMSRTLGDVMGVIEEAAVLNIGTILSRIKNGSSRLRTVVAGANLTPNTKPGESTASSPTSRSS